MRLAGKHEVRQFVVAVRKTARKHRYVGEPVADDEVLQPPEHRRIELEGVDPASPIAEIGRVIADIGADVERRAAIEGLHHPLDHRSPRSS